MSIIFVEDNAAMSSVRYFEKSCIGFCAKPKEIDPIELIPLQQISGPIALKYRINNSGIKISRIRTMMIATLFFYAPVSKDRGTYCFNRCLSVCPSVCLSAQT